MDMLNINPDTVCAIIEKCHEFHAKEEVSIPYDNPGDVNDDWAMQVLANHSGDSTLQEIKYIIDDLGPDLQQELVALMWLGRGDYTAEEWQDALDTARDGWTPRTAEYMAATPLVADYLEEGLSALGYGCGE